MDQKYLTPIAVLVGAVIIAAVWFSRPTEFESCVETYETALMARGNFEPEDARLTAVGECATR